MVRHSGFLPSLLAVTLAALAASVLEQRSNCSAESHRETRRPDDQTSLAAEQLPTNGDRIDSSTAQLPMSSDSAIRFQVPQNSLIIVGSLDTSGAAHSLRISTRPGQQWTPSDNGVSKLSANLRYIQSGSLPESHRRVPRLNDDDVTAPASKPLHKIRQSVTAQRLTGSQRRRFLIPHFEHDQIVQQPSEASAIAEGTRVRIYIDLSLVDTGSELPENYPLRDMANRACETIENELLPWVEQWIGRITDLDGDRYLSVVLTDLDRREFSDETPVLGCVRRQDFIEGDQNSLSGDILYLDQHLPPHEQLRALLAHELTHAAVFCIRHEAANDSPLKDHAVPSWLNEAAAHWVERQFCSAPAGFAEREFAFRQNPAQCPIILRDDDHFLTSRRAGSRVAGVTFLQQHVDDANAIRALLQRSTPFDQSVAAIANAPFSELFRAWSIRQACAEAEAVSQLQSRVDFCSLKHAAHGTMRRKLCGTAFLVLRTDVSQELCIDAHQDAQLQITVLHDSSPTSTLLRPDFCPINRMQTAELSTGLLQVLN